MPIPDPNGTLRRATDFAANATLRNLHAQAHARSILRNLRTPSPEWPNFRSDLDDRLHHAGHSLLWSGLQLLEVGHRRDEVRQLLQTGAEALEFLSANPRYPSACRIEQAVNATFGYYLAGHYARSYVLLRESVPDADSLPPAHGLLVAVLRKQLEGSRAITLRHLTDPSITDEAVAGALEDGQIGEEEAYNRILLRAAVLAVSYFLEFPKNGERPLLDEAVRILDDAVLIAQENRFVDWWWWLFCLRFLFQEFGEASLWSQLPPFRDGGDGSTLVDEYIRAGLRQEPPVMELWPSQQKAIPVVTDPARPNFCLKMPTSSGKTRVAELTILRFLLDYPLDPDAKCIFLAPFRSLALEVEQSLRRSFGGLGVLVSQIYGGFDVTPADLVSLRDYRVLVATPEKFDALLRCQPELAQSIRLVIIDEGHIVDPNERGLRFEFFVHRLLRRLPRPGCRFLFISAVLPNAEDFAEWVTGSPDGIVESNWRPSRLMLGRLSWDGVKARIDYTHQNRARFGQDCFLPRFIEQRPCRGVAGVGRRRNPFPHDAAEAFALSALLFAREGTTLVFVPQQRSVEPFAHVLLEALRLQRSLKQADGESFALPAPGRGGPEWTRCRSVIESEMGSDSLLLTLLDESIVIHHGDMPWRVRVAIEELARADAVRLLVATTTLAQGVNFPIKTVLVRGLFHGHNEPVSPTTFWNICGRAGRAMRESEGQILFCSDGTAPRPQQMRLERAIREVLDTLEQAKVSSALLLLLKMIASSWAQTHPNVGLAELCMHLADNRYDWAAPEQQDELRSWVDRLDGHLLCLSEEFGIEPTDLDRLQEILEGSLLFIQLRQQSLGSLTPEAARDVLHSRIRYIHQAHPNGRIRQRMYRLGMSLSASQLIEQEHPQLLALFHEATQWFEWTHDERGDLLLRLSRFIFELHDTRPTRPVPAEWPAILNAWLSGVDALIMCQDEAIRRFTTSASELSAFIEGLCDFRLPWGLNSILSYVSSVAQELGTELRTVCSYFSGMVKYGVDDPVAVCFIPYLDQDRRSALLAASVCPHDCAHPDLAIRWFLRASREDLERAGLAADAAMRIVSRRDQQRRGQRNETEDRPSDHLTLVVRNGGAEDLREGQKILVVPDEQRPGSIFRALTLDGISIGRFRHPTGQIPDWWRRTHLVDAEIVTVQDGTEGANVLVQIVGV
jgi:superfamily II DNA/RNA helicase